MWSDGWRHAARCAALLLALGAAPAARGAEPGTPPPAPAPDPATGLIRDGLQRLHRGEYRQAAAAFKEAQARVPDSPRPRFFLLFAVWWQRLFGEGATPDAEFDAAYADAVASARARLEAAPDDPVALAVLGGAEVLRSHVETQRGSYFRSGQAARRGKRALEQALDLDPNLDGALFPLGALNYYADRVPLLVKGLRPFLFFPGGDASLGLRQVRQVAQSDGALRTDARLLLALVCADHYQRAYAEALEQYAAALRDSRGSPLIRAAMADLEVRLGRFDAAVAALTAALDEARGEDPEQARERRWLRLGLAEALVADWRLDEAAAALAAARAESGATTPAMERTEQRIRAELEAKRPAVPAGSVPARWDLAALEASAAARPADAVVRLLQGRALLEAGHAADALASLREAEDLSGRDSPAWLLGWTALLSGRAETALGRTKEARAHLLRAANLKRFRSSDAAWEALGERGDEAGLCAESPAAVSAAPR